MPSVQISQTDFDHAPVPRVGNCTPERILYEVSDFGMLEDLGWILPDGSVEVCDISREVHGEDIAKIREFRHYLGDFPLVVGAGMTAETCAEQLAIADGGIVGTYFKMGGMTRARMDSVRVRRFMRAIQAEGGK